MKKTPPVHFLVLCLAYLALSLFLLEHTRIHAEKPHAEIMRDAARRAEKAFARVKEERKARGYPLDPALDPNETGLVGMEYTPITTSLGNLEAKRSTANPNCAAMIADMLTECGVSAGDTVCLNLSGSFPALDIAALCALDAIGAKAVSIHSIGASSYGANLPDFVYLDMEQVLLKEGLIGNHSRWFSLGSGRDRGSDMLDQELNDAIVRRLEGYGLTFLYFDDLQENLAAREEIYLSEAGGLRNIACFVNIGGNVLAFAGSDDMIDAANGILRYSERYADGDGLVPYFLRQNVPAIHLLNMKSLLPENGLPFDPVPMPKAGEGDVYLSWQYRSGLALLLAAGAAAGAVLLIWAGRKGRRG